MNKWRTGKAENWKLSIQFLQCFSQAAVTGECHKDQEGQEDPRAGNAAKWRQWWGSEKFRILGVGNWVAKTDLKNFCCREGYKRTSSLHCPDYCGWSKVQFHNYHYSWRVQATLATSLRRCRENKEAQWTKLGNGKLSYQLEDFLMSSSEAFKRTIKKRFIVSTSPPFSLLPRIRFPSSFCLVCLCVFGCSFLFWPKPAKEWREKNNSVLIKLRGIHLWARWHICRENLIIEKHFGSQDGGA